MDKVKITPYTTYVNNVPQHYIATEWLGLSTENKPNLLFNEKGSRFLCSDNGDEYIWSGSGWALVNAGSLVGTLENTVGNLPELDTAQKSSTVAAINEVHEDAMSTHYNRAVVFESDFYDVSFAFPGITAAAISSGTLTAASPTKDHPGVLRISDSTTANGGYKIFINADAFLISGGEKSEFIFQVGTGGARTTASARLGFQDASAIETLPTDGVWLHIVGDGTKATISGKANDSTGVATTDTSLTAELNTWYRATIELNADATLATFSVRTCADGLQVWGNTLATKIPTGAGRYTSWGMTAGETTTDAGAVIIAIDYANMSIDRTLVR